MRGRRIVLRGDRVRPCCDSPYHRDHLDDCPERGTEALAALPCDITVDGWCFNHSTGAGPVYCREGGSRG